MLDDRLPPNKYPHVELGVVRHRRLRTDLPPLASDRGEAGAGEPHMDARRRPGHMRTRRTTAAAERRASVGTGTIGGRENMFVGNKVHQH